MCINRFSKKKILMRTLGCLFSFFLFLGGNCFYQMKQSPPISIPASSRDIYFFYRDDCPDCQSVFPLIYGEKLLGKEIQWVNLNQTFNRQYIRKYGLKQVPTLLKNSKKETSTNWQKIQIFIEKNSE